MQVNSRIRRMGNHSAYITPQERRTFVQFLPLLILLSYLASVFITCISEWEHDHSHSIPAVQISNRISDENRFPSASTIGSYESQGRLVSNHYYSSSNGSNLTADTEIAIVLFAFLAMLSFSYFVSPLVDDPTRLKRITPRIHLLFQRFLN